MHWNQMIPLPRFHPPPFHPLLTPDVDTAARQLCEELGLPMVRARTVGNHPRFITMIRELIQERTGGAARQFLGVLGPSHDECPADCCPSGRPPPTRPAAS